MEARLLHCNVHLLCDVCVCHVLLHVLLLKDSPYGTPATCGLLTSHALCVPFDVLCPGCHGG